MQSFEEFLNEKTSMKYSVLKKDVLSQVSNSSNNEIKNIDKRAIELFVKYIHKWFGDNFTFKEMFNSAKHSYSREPFDFRGMWKESDFEIFEDNGLLKNENSYKYFFTENGRIIFLMTARIINKVENLDFIE